LVGVAVGADVGAALGTNGIDGDGVALGEHAANPKINAAPIAAAGAIRRCTISTSRLRAHMGHLGIPSRVPGRPYQTDGVRAAERYNG
jgi:hypothetical protein